MGVAYLLALVVGLAMGSAAAVWVAVGLPSGYKTPGEAFWWTGALGWVATALLLWA